MADTKIASLTDGLTTSGTDRIPVAISPYGSGNNAYITPSYLKTFMVTGGTVTSSTPVFDMTQTWNSGAVTFSGLKLNITDTASASGSLLMDLQVDGSSKFNVNKAGNVSAPEFSQAIGFGGISSSGGPWTASNGRMAFGGNFAGPFLQYDGNNSTLGLRDGTSAQTLNVYNTSTSSNANYERVSISYSITANVAWIRAEQGGTGSVRSLRLGTQGDANVYISTNGVDRLNISSAGIVASQNVTFSTDNAYDIGASGANRPRSIYAGTDVTAERNVLLNSGTGALYWGGKCLVKSPVDGVVSITKNNGTSAGSVQIGQQTVAALPSAATYPGSMAFVSDATATTARSTVAGGGSNKVMVMSDGTNWLIVA